jgi:hypothetical protein
MQSVGDPLRRDGSVSEHEARRRFETFDRETNEILRFDPKG